MGNQSIDSEHTLSKQQPEDCQVGAHKAESQLRVLGESCNFLTPMTFELLWIFVVVVVLFSFLLFFLDRILLCNFFFQDLRGEGCVCIYVCDMWVPVYMTAFKSQFSSPTLLG